MKENKLLNILLPRDSKKNILEKIINYMSRQHGFFHIVSLNPENIVIARKKNEFMKVVRKAQMLIIDGEGIILAAKILGIEVGERYPGVDLMSDLVKEADKIRLRILFIGGRPNLAEKLADCYSRQFPEAKFKGVCGIENIKNPKKNEEEKIFSIVADYKPHIVLVAFGSPEQELWLYRHRGQFDDCLCMGVGGAFDYLSGEVGRAPIFLRRIGLEWFYRLIRQPWRWWRQLRLIEFVYLVLRQKIFKKN